MQFNRFSKEQNFLKYFLALTISATCLSTAYAADEPSCRVIGVRQPGTNIYDGPTFCDAVSLSYITVRGPLTLNNTQIAGLTRVSGPMRASGAKLANLELKDTFYHITIELNAASTVNGDITFIGRSGYVKLSAGSVVHGKIINGEIISADKNNQNKIKL